jgi:hypothetical protein
MNAVTQVIVWLNVLANALGWLLTPIAWLPGWLSATVVGVVTGVLLLAVFKYTSAQKAIKRVRAGIDANLLTLRLFKESVTVALQAQAGLLDGAFRLLLLGLVPLAVMILPVALLLGQLALWYQSRPLHVGEEAVVTMTLDGDPDDPMPEVCLDETSAVENLVGPVRAPSNREVCWKLEARENGLHRLTFQVDGRTVEKELAIGDGFMRVSAQRPGWNSPVKTLLENPREEPFPPDSAVKSIEISYPTRPGWTCGSAWADPEQPGEETFPTWMAYWFVVSLLAAFCSRGVLKVNT